MLGPDLDPTFDTEIMIHINAALTTLAQVGACAKGSLIMDENATWGSIFPTQGIMSKARTYIYYRVRLGFDPPQSSYAIENMNKLADEELWRINHYTDYEDDEDE